MKAPLDIKLLVLLHQKIPGQLKSVKSLSINYGCVQFIQNIIKILYVLCLEYDNLYFKLNLIKGHSFSFSFSLRQELVGYFLWPVEVWKDKETFLVQFIEWKQIYQTSVSESFSFFNRWSYQESNSQYSFPYSLQNICIVFLLWDVIIIWMLLKISLFQRHAPTYLYNFYMTHSFNNRMGQMFYSNLQKDKLVRMLQSAWSMENQLHIFLFQGSCSL